MCGAAFLLSSPLHFIPEPAPPGAGLFLYGKHPMALPADAVIAAFRSGAAFGARHVGSSRLRLRYESHAQDVRTLTIPTNSALVLPSAPRAAKQVRSIRPTITLPRQ